MDTVIHKSINSIKSINASDVYNPSTARLLIDHIKRLVEDDMKSTVDAFQSIEREIDVELGSSFRRKKCRSNKKTANSTNASSSRQTKRHSFPANHQEYLLSAPSSVEGGRPLDSRNEFRPKSTSTPLRNEFSFPSIDNSGTVPSFGQSESIITNPASDSFKGYQSYSDDDPSKFNTIGAMYKDLKADLNRILLRFVQDSDQRITNIPTTTSDNMNYATSHAYAQTSQSSYGAPSRYSVSTKKNGKRTPLPRLLAFGDNCINDTGVEYAGEKGFTVISDHFGQHDKTDRTDYVDRPTERMDPSPYTTDLSCSKTKDNIPEERQQWNPIKKCSDEINEERNDVEKPYDNETDERLPPDTDKNPQQKASGQVIDTYTVEANNLPENQVNKTHEDVTITDDVDDESTLTIQSTHVDDDLTDTISSSLIVTPKMQKKSSKDCSDVTDLDEIALLISRASPNRRVIIKKKVPDSGVKGYKNNCNEKLIFTGDKITHVKMDRKIICRQYYPKFMEK